eukprot:364820-Chlamydomonas_euryale.AAC.1
MEEKANKVREEKEEGGEVVEEANQVDEKEQASEEASKVHGDDLILGAMMMARARWEEVGDCLSEQACMNLKGTLEATIRGAPTDLATAGVRWTCYIGYIAVVVGLHNTLLDLHGDIGPATFEVVVVAVAVVVAVEVVVGLHTARGGAYPESAEQGVDRGHWVGTQERWYTTREVVHYKGDGTPQERLYVAWRLNLQHRRLHHKRGCTRRDQAAHMLTNRPTPHAPTPPRQHGRVLPVWKLQLAYCGRCCDFCVEVAAGALQMVLVAGVEITVGAFWTGLWAGAQATVCAWWTALCFRCRDRIVALWGRRC